jgi:hypothetical protein
VVSKGLLQLRNARASTAFECDPKELADTSLDRADEHVDFFVI